MATTWGPNVFPGAVKFLNPRDLAARIAVRQGRVNPEDPPTIRVADFGGRSTQSRIAKAYNVVAEFAKEVRQIVGDIVVKQEPHGASGVAAIC